MNSDSFDKYIKDKITSIEDEPMQEWDSSSLWKDIENKNKKPFFIVWKHIAIAASIIFFIGNISLFSYQYNNKCKEISALREENKQNNIFIIQIQEQLAISNSNSNSNIKESHKLNKKKEPEYKKECPFEKINVLPIVIHQADIIINNIEQEVKLIVLNIHKKQYKKTNTQQTIAIKYETEKIEKLNKKKFKISLFNKRNNIFASK